MACVAHKLVNESRRWATGARAFMFRTKMEMSLPSFLREQADGVLLSIKLQPRASANEIGGVVGSELRVKVTAAPVDAAANEALVRFLGCDEVIDYTAQEVSNAAGRFDAGLDLIGGKTLQQMFDIMKPGTRIVSVAALPEPQTAIKDLGGRRTLPPCSGSSASASDLELNAQVSAIAISSCILAVATSLCLPNSSSREN